MSETSIYSSTPFWRTAIRDSIGTILMLIFPRRVSALRKSPTRYASSRLDRWLMGAMVTQAVRRKDAPFLAELHREEWANFIGVNFAQQTQARFEEWFLKQHVSAIDAFENRLAIPGNQRHVLCEIGTGAGQVLHYLADRFPQLKRVIGLDICADQIASNNAANENPLVEFHAGDGLCWINENGEKECVYVSNGGVLEYFSQSELEQLYHKVAYDFGPSTFVIIEPVDNEHDFENQQESKPFGEEKSFSHNHRKLLQKHGFDIVHEHETTIENQRFVQIVAECGVSCPVDISESKSLVSESN